ncbi:MAG TPA: hypothetical protein VD996_11190, partial [Chitinophagaceae bacterium]|nr:hypothetical protein [Chitinophagaceae bacterium]
MRKHPRYLFTVIIFTVLNGYAYAQGPNPLPSNIASAPSVNGKGAGLANLYTGQPQIQILLLSYGVHDLSHNVSLLYNATGTTVSQIASPVGLGWSLSATYFVKRIAVGPPDEFKYLQGGTWKSSGYLVTGNIPSTPTRADLDNFYYNKADGEADIYLFSIPGQSGRIIINKSGLVVKTIPESGLSITPTMQPGGGRIISFIIRTESGLVYEFTEEEVIKYKTKIDNTDYEFDYTSTWFVKAFYHHLDPAAKITFDYGSYYSNDILGKQDFTARANNANVHFALGSICYASQGSCCVQTWSYATEDIKVNGYLKRLNRVNFPDGAYYRFLHTYSRCDLTHEGALLSMEQYNQLGTLMKRYEFGYAYFSESGEVGFEDCSTLDLTKKLKLKSITEYISYSNALPPYTFEYESSINLPARTSTDIDEWGFLPKSSSLPDGGSKAYVLTRINYPTGSYVTYEYELNQVGWTKSSSQLQTLSGLRVKKITVSEGTNVAPSSNTVTEAHYTYLNNSSASSGEVDYLPFKKFYTYLNYHSVASCVGGNQYSNVEMENRINQSPVAPFPTGNACGYSMVTEEIKSGTDVLGKQVYHFKNFSDYVNDPSISGAAGTMDFPYSNRQYNIPWGLGLLKMIEVKDKDGNVVKRTENDYTVYSTRQTAQNLASLKIGLWYGPVNRSGSAVNGEVYKYDIYGPLTGYTQLDKARDVQVFYDGSTAQEVTSEVTYEYVPNKKLIRSKYAFNSAGNKVKTIYYYPFDYNFTNEQSANPGIGMLNM